MKKFGLLSSLLNKKLTAKLGVFVFLIALSFTACQEMGDGVEPPTPQQPEPTPTPEPSPNFPSRPDLTNYVPAQEPVTANVFGFVVDENDQPLAGAEVELENAMTTTDEFGHFSFENVSMNGLGTMVKVKQAGYFDGSRRFFPTAGDESRVKIELIPRVVSGTFNTSAKGTVAMNDGAEVDFTNANIVDENGDPYTGEVQVASYYLDPTDERTFEQMPGNLQGIDSEAEDVALVSYGMMVVELEGAGNQSLNIGDSTMATITMPVPQELLADAPAEIPLWSFDETFGVWIQEGTATLQNGEYVGEVSHFSFWNCDAPFELIKLDFRLLDPDQQPLNNYRVAINRKTATGFRRSGTGYSDKNGKVSGLVPANEELELEVFDLCGNVIYTELVGPFSSNTSLGDIVMTDLNLNETVVSGNLVGCDGADLNAGLVLIEFDGKTIYHYTDGSDFSVSFITCASTSDIQVTGVDLGNLKQSDVFSAQPNVANNLGTILVCADELENFIRLTVDNETVIYPNAQVFVDDSTTSGTNGEGFTFISSSANEQGSFVGFGFNGVTVGDYSTNNFIEGIFDQSRGWSLRPGDQGFETFMVTEYGVSGEPIKGRFSGTFTNFASPNNSDSTQVQVSGEFNVTRK